MRVNQLRITPCDIGEANAFVRQFHRHHGPLPGAKFAIGATVDGEAMCGVVMVGRPVGRYMDDGKTLEVTRLCTDGTRNACSLLYAAAWRATRAMGYTRLITYVLSTESGTSLKAAGWKEVGRTTGRSWNVPSRPRVDKHPLQERIRFEVSA